MQGGSYVWFCSTAAVLFTFRFLKSIILAFCVGKKATLPTVLDKFALDYNVCSLINRVDSGLKAHVERVDRLKALLIEGQIRGTGEYSLLWSRYPVNSQ